MAAKLAQDIKYECIPGEDLDKYGLMKIKDPLNKYFPIAVVGIGLHMPSCDNVTEFQKILEEERCVIGPVPNKRWIHDEYYTPDPQEKGKYCITKLAFYMKYFHFDPNFFNMSTREASFIDAQHRQCMETTELALQDAGIDTLNVPKDTGVYLGMGIIDIPGALSENRHLYNGHTVNGMAHTAAANRVSHHYGLEGPSCAVDTACAASMTAVHVGIMSMWNKECRMAIAGATSQVYSPECVIAFSQLGVLSPTGNSAPFDESNNGYVRSEGTGIVILKSIDDAIRDGDHIYCVIRGTTSAHNGYSMSLTLPSAPAQINLIQKCYEQFGVDMSIVDYVEAHGTGTPVGDPIEVSALGKTFGASRPRGQPLRIASAKVNFGHLEVCAGMVQVIKVAIMLEQRRYFKHINWHKPNHRMNLEDANIQMQLQEDYYTKPNNMVIGVNTFGFSGSLVHQIFEEYRFKHGECHPKCLAGWSFGANPSTEGRLIAMPFSAKTKTALTAQVKDWLKWSCDEDAQQIASWMATRRTAFKEHRLVVLTNSADDFKSKLQLWLDDKPTTGVIYFAKGRKVVPSPEVCFVFSGWGQQWFDMGRKLYDGEEVFRVVVDECDNIFQTIAGYSALKKFNIFTQNTKPLDSDAINGDACKPAILFMQLGLAEQLKHWGVDAVSFFGVGMGELSAAFASGAIGREDAVRLMHIRMSAPPKAEFTKAVNEVLKGKVCSSGCFYSPLTTKKYDGSLDSAYWWKNITEKSDIPMTIKNIHRDHPHTMFVEVAADVVLQSTIEETLRELQANNSVVSCGRKNSDDRQQLLSAISFLHVRNFQLNWKNITMDCAKHAQMPLYTFDDEEIWFETINYKKRRTGLQDRSYRAQNGRVNIFMHPFLKSYHLDDKQLFPAAALVEYFSEYDDSPYCFLTNVKIHNLAEVPEPDSIQRYTSLFLNMEKNGANLKAVSDDKILAEARLGKGNEFVDQPTINVAGIKVRTSRSISGDELLQKFENLGLSYGMHYKTIEETQVGNGEAIAFCCPPHPLCRTERIEAVVLESAFQVAIGVFTRGNSLYLPSGIQQLQMFVTKVPSYTPYVVHTTLNNWSLRSINCDLTIADQEGMVWLVIKGFEAKSRVEFNSGVDLGSCIYTPKWQSNQASLGVPPAFDLGVNKSEIQDATQRIDSLIGEFCKDMVQNLAINDEKIAFLKTLASPGITTVHADYSVEGKAIKIMADELLSYNSDSRFPSEPLKIVLRESPMIRDYIKEIAKFIQGSVDRALESKHVVRICEVASSFGSLTKEVLSLLKNYLGESRVHYSYLGKDMSDCEDVDQYVQDLPKISYYANTEETLQKLTNSFDMVIQFDPIGQFEDLSSGVANLLLDGGWFVGARGGGACQLFPFFTGCKVQEKILSLMTKAGLENSKLYGSFDDIVAFGVVVKGPVDVSNTKGLILAGMFQKGITQKLNSLMTMPVQVTPIVDLEQVMTSVPAEGKILNVVIRLESAGDSKTWKLVHDLVSRIEGIDLNPNVHLWVLNSNSGSEASAAAALLSAANNNGMQLRSISIDPRCNESTIASFIFKAIVNGNSAESVFRLHKGGTQVSRLIKLHVMSEKVPKLRPQEVQVRREAFDYLFDGNRGFNIFAGHVVSVGADVTSYEVGNRVVGFTKLDDPFVVIPFSEIHLFTKGLSWQEAVDSIKNLTLAYLGLVRKVKIKPGDNVLCTSLDSSLAKAAVILAQLHGARVFLSDTSGSGSSKFLHSLQNICVVNPESLTFHKEMMSLTNGKGINVVVHTEDDCISGFILRTLAVKAKICCLGVTTASSVMIPNVRQLVVNYLVYLTTPRGNEELHSAVSKVTQYLATGRIQNWSGCEEKPQAPSNANNISQIRMQCDSTYIVLGGLGRLGLQVARWLCERGAKQIALVSRKAQLNDFDKSTVKHLEENGCKVHLIFVEVKELKDFAKIFSKLDELCAAPVKGVFNLVGSSANWLDNSAQNISETLECQANVTRLAHEATLSMRLDFFVVFSSCLSMLGSSKLSAPTVNGGYINGVIGERKKLGLPGLSYQIGLVRGVGSVSGNPDAITALEELGMQSLHFEEYLALLGNLLQGADLPGCVMVINQDWSQTAKTVSDNLWMRHLLTEGVQQETGGGLSKAELYEQMSKELVAAMTCCPIETIETHLPMQTYGVDSLMSQEIVSWADKKLKITLKQDQVFAGLTIAQMVEIAV